MLDHLHIQNYRLFKDLKIDKLGQVNLIAGKNNTGKTALLEAIALCKSNINHINRLLSSFIRLRGEFELPYNEVIDLFCDSRFRINKDELINDFKIIENEFAIERIRVTFITFEIIVQISDFYILKDENSSSLKVFNTKFTDLEIYSNSTDSDNIDKNFTDLSNSIVFLPFKTSFNIGYLWGNVDLTPRKKEVIQILQIIEPKIIDIGIDITTRQPKILLDGDFQPTPIDRFGDGVSRLFRIALCLVNAKHKTLLIDEFEVGLHHSVQEQLWDIIFKYAKEWNIQVFVTTHSQDTVRAFSYISSKDEYKDMGQYMRLQPSRKTGEIEAVIYPQDSLENSLDLNLETR